MQESVVFLVRVQCRRKESSRSLSPDEFLVTTFCQVSMDPSQNDAEQSDCCEADKCPSQPSTSASSDMPHETLRVARQEQLPLVCGFWLFMYSTLPRLRCRIK